jgi:GNAT superfamily N-acetyltransferase
MSPCASVLLLLLIPVSFSTSFSIQPFSSPTPHPKKRQQEPRPHHDDDDVPAGRRRTATTGGGLLRLHDQRNRQQAGAEVLIRGATADEAAAARQVLLGHAMNPLFVSERNLVVATGRNRPTPSTTTASRDGDGDVEKKEEEERVIGFGQIRPVPQDEKNGGGVEDPTSSSSSDNPTGSASLWELASLFVDPEHRRMGVGTAIIQELLRRHDEQQQHPQEQEEWEEGTVPEAMVLLLTLAPTAPLYEPHGFRIVDAMSPEFRNLPKSVRLEHAAGKALSWILGNELVCMVRR